MEFKGIRVDIPEGCNIILGQTHFIKTAEDLRDNCDCGATGDIRCGLHRGIRTLPYQDRRQ